MTKREKILRMLALSLSALLIACSGGCSRPEPLMKDTRVIMGTYVTITAVKGDKTDEDVRKAIDAAFDEITRVDVLMSTYKPESQLSEVNRRSGTAPVTVDPELIETVEDAVLVARLTGGAFDPTVGPLVKLWKVGSDEARLPDKAEIDRVRRLVDYSQIEIDKARNTLFIKKKGMSLDLGGIAKGYSADRAVDALKKRGIKGGIVAVAGDLKLFGSREDGRPWEVGVQHPREKDSLLCRLELHDAATSTSGDYERYFMKDGVRYHHIMNPKTGYPARGLMSVTVIAKDSWLADSMGTGLFVMGPDKAYKLALEHPEIEVLMVTSEGKILATGRFKGMNLTSSHHVSLTWTPSTSPILAGYKIYFGTSSGAYTQSVAAGKVTSYTIGNLSPGTRYYFALTTYDSYGNESPLSKEVSVSTP